MPDETDALEETLRQALEGGKVNLGGLVVERVHVEGTCNGEGDEVRFVEARIAYILAVALELALGDFEQANGTGAVLFVFGNALEQVRKETGRNHAEFVGKRVQQSCGLAAAVVIFGAEQSFGAGLSAGPS